MKTESLTKSRRVAALLLAAVLALCVSIPMQKANALVPNYGSFDHTFDPSHSVVDTDLIKKYTASHGVISRSTTYYATVQMCYYDNAQGIYVNPNNTLVPLSNTYDKNIPCDNGFSGYVFLKVRRTSTMYAWQRAAFTWRSDSTTIGSW